MDPVTMILELRSVSMTGWEHEELAAWLEFKTAVVQGDWITITAIPLISAIKLGAFRVDNNSTKLRSEIHIRQ